MSTPSDLPGSLDRRFGLAAIRASGHEGSGVTVAVVDTGISPHDDLHGVIASERDFTGEDAPRDRPGPGGHGTALARAVHFVAPRAAIANFKVFPRHDGFSLAPGPSIVRTAVVEALEHCLAEYPRYRVVNLSLSLSRRRWFRKCAPGSLCEVCTAVNRLADAGVLVVVAAGNDGPRPDTIECPGLAEGAITVGATLSPEEEARWRASENSAGSFGTSFSSAYVAGGVALLLSACPEATPGEVRASLKQAAQPVPGAPVEVQGAGMVHFGRALALLAGPSHHAFESAMRALYFSAGNGDAQRPDNPWVTQRFALALDYVEKTLVRRNLLDAAAVELQKIRSYLVPGRLPEIERRIDSLDPQCRPGTPGGEGTASDGGRDPSR